MIGIFPNDVAVICLGGVMLAKQHEGWQAGLRYCITESPVKLT